ncbi:hypothetical protein UCRPC4_g00117 [Phaeomoniella chlamydospora]|uniref:Protein arginine methyltransferase NDUFAF7 n=1 Tax=Phaeomoniella chlamydospora TaxID=158046 RepID=A0A0G2H1D5_PHACM|nr:hypothetical protein UCRPC4_g00117 [Phaeomoniella chlamydospora]
MRQCLTSSDGGYYTTVRESGDPFGKGGDFVTSPEISQIFGELVGIWFLTEWMAQGAPHKGVRLIEMGPGRGTLMDDMLRALRNFKSFTSAVDSVLLVEASPSLREAQRALLCGDHPFEDTPNGQKSISKYSNILVEWIEDMSLLDPPSEKTRIPFFIAHEFFDALPIHAFKTVPKPIETESASSNPPIPRKAPSGPQWRELVVAMNTKKELDTSSEEPEFQLSVAKAGNPNSMVIPETSNRYKKMKNNPDAYIEISPESQKFAQEIARHIGGLQTSTAKGAALIIDYGTMFTIPINSLRGIQKHKIVSPFASPGQVDISADVDFTALAEAALEASPNVEVHGPVEQGHFLHALGIEDRAKQLLRRTTDETKKKDLETAWKRLVERSGSGMGKIYKALAVVPESGGKRRPIGFGGDVAV